jgi:hypothetical protein
VLLAFDAIQRPNDSEIGYPPNGTAEETFVPRSLIHAVVTDVHLWIPVVVLVLGAALLIAATVAALVGSGWVLYRRTRFS